MSNSNHPIEQEELMAYLDGELPIEQAASAANHLETCRECQSLAADLRVVSQKLINWEIEEPESSLDAAVFGALEEQEKTPKAAVRRTRWNWRQLFTMRRLVWAGGISAGLVVVLMISIPNMMRVRERQAAEPSQWITTIDSLHPAPSGSQRKLRRDGTIDIIDGRYASRAGKSGGLVQPPKVQLSGQGQEQDKDSGESEDQSNVVLTGPMIIRTAQLTVTTKDFGRAQPALEDILRRHRGYIGELKISTPTDSQRTLDATVRVPSDQLDATLAELRKLGRVESETQGGEEVTQRYVDLVARLKNSKNTEQTLLDILRNRTGKLSDVLQVEKELSRVRGEIEEMEAERKELAKQVAFATVTARIAEEYKAQLQAVPESTSTQFRNAAVEGYRTMVDGIVAVLLFLIAVGPTILLWGAILFFPARMAWKRLGKKAA